jgi:hypothetical protein
MHTPLRVPVASASDDVHTLVCIPSPTPDHLHARYASSSMHPHILKDLALLPRCVLPDAYPLSRRFSLDPRDASFRMHPLPTLQPHSTRCVPQDASPLSQHFGCASVMCPQVCVPSIPMLWCRSYDASIGMHPLRPSGCIPSNLMLLPSAALP